VAGEDGDHRPEQAAAPPLKQVPAGRGSEHEAPEGAAPALDTRSGVRAEVARRQRAVELARRLMPLSAID
jgi:hypothetical protein